MKTNPIYHSEESLTEPGGTYFQVIVYVSAALPKNPIIY